MENQKNDKGLVELSELVAVGEMATEIVERVDVVKSRVTSVRSEVQQVDIWDSNLCF